jgi:hypothetical protein
MKPTVTGGITPTMRTMWLAVLTAFALHADTAARQAPAAVDTSKLGPQVGAVAPAFTGVDQLGKTRTLASAYGPKGAMLVFFRSADW